ncbi:MAG: hypothetical protein AAFO81_12440 [Pseudomonadota bacterium]
MNKSTQRWRRSLTAVAIATILGACNAPADQYQNAKSVQSDGTIAALASADVKIADLAVNVLADELDLPVSQITVDSVRTVTWPDGSVGCPQPGQAYGQVLTPGHKITLRAEGRVYVIHEANQHAFLCKRQKAVAEITPEFEFSWAPQAAIARKDLAGILGVAENDIIIANGSRRAWPDSSMGCEATDTPVVAVRTEGFAITLRYGSRNYTYHTDMERVIACPPIAVD